MSFSFTFRGHTGPLVALVYKELLEWRYELIISYRMFSQGLSKVISALNPSTPWANDTVFWGACNNFLDKIYTNETSLAILSSGVFYFHHLKKNEISES